jgi:hypothetical protein
MGDQTIGTVTASAPCSWWSHDHRDHRGDHLADH